MAQEVRADLLLGRDTLSPGLIKAGRAAASASGDLKDLSDKLKDVDGRAAKARVGLEGDKEAGQSLDKLTAKIVRLAGRKVDPEVDLQGYLRTRAEITGIELELDRLDAKRPKVHIDTSALSKLSLFKPSALGTALALTPALIPLTAQVAAGVGAIGVSFAAAGVAAAGFGLLAGNVLTKAASDSQKLETLQASQSQQMASLQTRLGQATTKAQRQALEQQIANLKASQARQTAVLTQGWSGSYRQLVTLTGDFQDRWEKVSRSIATPALIPWLQAVTRGMQFLKPALEPVAALFDGLGRSLNAAFANNAPRVRDLAAAFGQFAAIQLADVARFIMDIAKGIFNLGKDLAANGANFSAAGTWLAGIGDGFLAWSQSKKARDDVQGFMKFLHDEGPVVRGILKDLGTILPGIFAGATTVGTLELQALGNFLNLVAGLPPGWQKPLTEFAGAMLLLSKIGVVKVGLKLTGLESLGGLTAGAGAAGGPLAVAGAAIAAGLVLKVREDLKAGIKGIGADLPKWFSGIGGVVSLSASGWADAILTHFDKPVRAAWAAIGRYLAASASRNWKAITDSFHAFAHTMAASFDAFRHDVATAWDTIWRNTVTRTRHGIDDAVRYFHTLPGRAIGALSGLGSMLYSYAHQALVKFGNGAKAVWGSIVKWFKGLPGTILHALGIHSPPDWAISAGRHVMQGILGGLHLGSGGITGFIAGLPGKIGALLTGGSSGATGGDALANQRLARSIFPWGASQWPAFVSLVMAESGFNRYARNPSSGAYGIPQALPPSKLPFAGQAAGGSHAGPQLSWMFNYIRGRYGTPANAWGHELAYRWYDKGGWLPPGLTLALNTTGRPEQVISGRGGSSGPPVVLEIRSSGRRADDLLVELIRDAVRVRGGGNVQVALGKRN